jgi:hypothetical protein
MMRSVLKSELTGDNSLGEWANDVRIPGVDRSQSRAFIRIKVFI